VSQANLTPRAFVDKWQHAANLKERSAAQEHFIDLCRLVGHPTPAEMDPEGARFTFEAGAAKQGGGEGWADVWKRGAFAWEYKGRHANLDRAYDQLLQYREALQNPPLLIVSDMATIRIHTNFTNTVKTVYELTLDDLLAPAQLRVLRNAFFEPEQLRAPQTPEQVTQEAAAEFARLAEQLRAYGDGYTNEQIAQFLIRLLFCLFAEDAGLLPEGIFSMLIEHTQGHSKAFQGQLQQLFGAMREGGWFGAHRILYFDGHLFDRAEALELDGSGMRTLARISRLDWSSVEPSIFGTLFERSLDPEKRSQLGAHYTSREDIELIVEPVLMAPLRRRWEAVKAQADALIAERDAAPTPSVATRRQNELNALLQGFQRELADVHVLDPACGSGNFLYVALRQLLDLEKAVGLYGGQLLQPQVSPEQLHGIEINAYAHELAQVTIWIGYLQWLQDNGFGFGSEPILKPLDTIRRMDAILTYDAAGNPVEPEWPAANVIISNPPFLGSRKMRSTLGDEYCNDLLAAYEGRMEGLPDLVCYWFEKARWLVQKGQVSRVGLLATQAIRGRSNRQVLERIKNGGDIFLAWSDREWILDGATVHVAIVGFDDGSERERWLDGRSVRRIHADLTSGPDLTQAQQLQENAALSYQGVVLRGSFDLSKELAQKMLEAGGNPNGRPNSDVIAQRALGRDITGRQDYGCVIDFGVDMSKAEAAQYVLPFEYVKETVYPARQRANQASARELWWRYWNTRKEMRARLTPLDRYIGTPTVSKHRLFVWICQRVLPDHQIIAIARQDDYFFGVLQSQPHELWATSTGTQLRDARSGRRYTPTTTFETFPFPWPPGEEPGEDEDPRVAAIAEAARELVAQRDRWLNPGTLPASSLKKRTLTNLYNQQPTWLQLAHEKLDHAVLDAYGWPHDLDDEEILARLLALNLTRAVA
jgi:hypothetical protein